MNSACGRRFASPRVIFLNRFFFPDHSATSQLLGDLAFHVAAQGRDVHVITSRQTYDRPEARLPVHERVRDVDVHRVWTSQYGRGSLPGRAVDYLSFYAAAGVKLAALARPGDVVIAKTDPPMLSVLTSALGRHGRLNLINWLQDIYPEVSAELGLQLLRGPLGKALRAVRDRSLRAARINVAIGKEMAERIAALGVRPEATRIIPNWCDDESFASSPEARHSLRREWSLDGKFVVGYSGNLGRAHEFDTLIGAADALKNVPDIHFLFIGGGHQFSLAKALALSRGLRNIHFKPYQARGDLPLSLTAADVHWVSLRPELRGLLVPSKFYGIAAASRPIIVITAPQSELGRLVREHDCGFAVAPGDSHGLSEILQSLAQDRSECIRLGRNARKMLEEKFSKADALRRWASVIDEVVRANNDKNIEDCR